jgi:hypothetical protein
MLQLFTTAAHRIAEIGILRVHRLKS